MKVMKVLDIDMDFFLNEVSTDLHGEKRVPDSFYEVWSCEEIIDYLENILNLSKNKKIKGRIVNTHNESLDFWNELKVKGKLNVPFDIIHVDSHSDLGYYNISSESENKYSGYKQLSGLPSKEDRYNLVYLSNSKEIHDEWLNEGNYLVFALMFEWVNKLIYCTNIYEKYNEDDYDDKFIKNILEKDGILYKQWKLGDYKASFQIVTKKCKSEMFKDYDFITFSKSPKFTPKKADFIIDIIKDYIEEI